MPAWLWVLIVLAILVGVGLAAWRFSRWGATARRAQAGPEQHRPVEGLRPERPTKTETTARTERGAALEIRTLEEAARRDYAERWDQTQALFVESPQLAIAEADILVRSVMLDRGYPVAETEQRMTDASVEHPEVMDHFRLATAIAAEARAERASSERLRQAMVHFRALFGRLLAEDTSSHSTARSS